MIKGGISIGEVWTVLGVILIILGVCGLTAGQVYISVMKKRIREESERVQGRGIDEMS